MGAFDQARLHGLPQPSLEIKYWRAMVSIAHASVSTTSSDRPACSAAFNKKIPGMNLNEIHRSLVHRKQAK